MPNRTNIAISIRIHIQAVQIFFSICRLICLTDDLIIFNIDNRITVYYRIHIRFVSADCSHIRIYDIFISN